ncbi:IS66-like element accessory protein TnpA [Falsiroseomonas sp.]|uniref:IS66-like element accessory protein TnpA n=1 Tax=Falsiroseomonas sp. TaxID=2870721 RepID=UPI003F6FA26F
MEIISGVERRRQWRVEDKLRIVAEAERPGACFADVARRHEVSRSVLWGWRKQVRSGALAVEQMPAFMPVQIAPEPPSNTSASPCSLSPEATAGRDAQRIEIVLPDGTAVRVLETVGTTALRRVLSALRG